MVYVGWLGRIETNDSTLVRMLRQGRWDGVITPHPPVQRSIRLVEKALRAQGHELIDFDIPNPDEANRLPVC